MNANGRKWSETVAMVCVLGFGMCSAAYGIYAASLRWPRFGSFSEAIGMLITVFCLLIIVREILVTAPAHTVAGPCVEDESGHVRTGESPSCGADGVDAPSGSQRRHS